MAGLSVHAWSRAISRLAMVRLAHLEEHRYFDAIALAWVALWNYTIDCTSATTDQIQWACKGLFDLPTDQLVDILSKRKAAFFPDDNRCTRRSSKRNCLT